MAKVFFENEKTRKKYEVVKFDTALGKVRLRSEAGFEFDENYRPELFRQMGYELRQGD